MAAQRQPEEAGLWQLRVYPPERQGTIQKQNTLSSQVHMEHSPGLITCCTTKQASINLRKLKSYQASFLTTLHEFRYQLQGKKL